MQIIVLLESPNTTQSPGSKKTKQNNKTPNFLHCLPNQVTAIILQIPHKSQGSLEGNGEAVSAGVGRKQKVNCSKGANFKEGREKRFQGKPKPIPQRERPTTPSPLHHPESQQNLGSSSSLSTFDFPVPGGAGTEAPTCTGSCKTNKQMPRGQNTC